MANNTLIIGGFTSPNSVLIIDGFADKETQIYTRSFLGSGLISVYGSSESTIQQSFVGIGKIKLSGTFTLFPELYFISDGQISLTGSAILFPEINISGIGQIKLNGKAGQLLVALYPVIIQLEEEEITSFNFYDYFKYPSSLVEGFIPYRTQDFTYSNFFIGGESHEISSDFSYTEWWKSGTKLAEIIPTFNYWNLMKRGSKVVEVTPEKNYVDLMRRGAKKFGKINVEYNYSEDFFN